MEAATRIQTGATERIWVVALDGSLVELTGVTDLLLSIRRLSDGWHYDFDDDTFKASGWTTRQIVLIETDATNEPGMYHHDFDTSAITSATADDTYFFRVEQSPGTTVKNVPFTGEIKVGQFIDDLDAAISTRATPAQVKTEADQALVGYDPPTQAEMTAEHGTLSTEHAAIPAAVDAELTGNHGAGAWNTGDPAAIADAVLDEPLSEHTTPGSLGEAMGFKRAVLGNKIITDPVTGVMTIYASDDVTPLYTAQAYEDAAGTQTYRGRGAERREKLE